MLKERPLLQLQAKVDSMLYVSHKEIGNFEIALKKLESYDQIKLQIRNQAQKEKLEQLTLQFETEKKDLLIKNQEISLLEIKAKNRVFIVSIVLLGTLTFFLIYILVKNSKTRNLLFKKERELDQAALFAHLPERNPDFQDLNLISKEGENNEQKLFNELVSSIKEKKLYLDPNINQQTVVSEFGTNRQYLYEAISKSGEDNFRGMINRFRINNAKELIEKGKLNGATVDFNDISEKSGFNSYATFYRAFKSVTGLTPNEYTKELEKEGKN
jgi:AraC-like DNA-binding protein